MEKCISNINAGSGPSKGKVDENGNIVDNTWEELQKYLASHPTGNSSGISAESSSRMSTSSSGGSWTPIGPFDPPGPTGQNNDGIGRIDAIAFHPELEDVMYAGSPTGGLWKSCDAGFSWHPIGDQWTLLGVSDIAIDPQHPDTLYVATGDRDSERIRSRGIQKSTDGGETWELIPIVTSGSHPSRVRKIVIHEQNTQQLLVATTSGIFKSTNGGLTWSLQTIEQNYYDVELMPGNSEVVYVSTSDRIYNSADFGNSYSLLTTPYNSGEVIRIELAVTPADSLVLVSNAYPGNTADGPKAYKSNDGGATFQLICDSSSNLEYVNGGSINMGDLFWSQGSINWCVAINPNDASDILIGGINLIRTYDNGVSWKYLTTGNFGGGYIHVDMHTLSFNPHNNIAYVGCDGGLYKHNVDGQIWNRLHYGMNITQFYRFANSHHASGTFIAGNQDNGVMLLDSSNWTHELIGDGADGAINPGNSNNIISHRLYGGGLSMTNDRGASWNTLSLTSIANEFQARFLPLQYDPVQRNTLYVVMQNVWKSKDNGDNWINITEGRIGNSRKFGFEVSEANNQVLYVTSQNNINGGLKVSLDGGETWEQKPDLPVTVFAGMEIHPEFPNIIYLIGYGGVIVSDDYGSSWTDITANLPEVSYNAIVFQKGSNNELYLATDIGVFYKNNLEPWQLYDSGIPSVLVSDIHIDYNQSKIIASTYGRGLWEAPLKNSSTICFLEETPSIQESYHIEACLGDTVTIHSSIAPMGYTYQWYESGQELIGENNDSLIVSQSGNYSVLFNGNCHSTFSEATLVDFSCTFLSCVYLSDTSYFGPGNMTALHITDIEDVPDLNSMVEIKLWTVGSWGQENSGFKVFDENFNLLALINPSDNCEESNSIDLELTPSEFATFYTDDSLSYYLDPIISGMSNDVCSGNAFFCSELKVIPMGSCGIFSVDYYNITCNSNSTIDPSDDFISAKIYANSVNSSPKYRIEGIEVQSNPYGAYGDTTLFNFELGSSGIDLLEFKLVDSINNECIYTINMQNLDNCSGCGDLKLSKVIIDTISDGNISFHYYIINSGLIPINIAGVSIQNRLSEDNIYDENDPAFGGTSLSSSDLFLSPGDSILRQFSNSYPGHNCSLPYLVAKVNKFENVEECTFDNNTAFQLMDTSLSCGCSGVICGCTDSFAHNFNSIANLDDSSCETCSDGILNGDEIMVDCGGILCDPCPSCSTATALSTLNQEVVIIKLDSMILDDGIYEIVFQIDGNPMDSNNIIVFEGSAQLNIIPSDTMWHTFSLLKIKNSHGCVSSFNLTAINYQFLPEIACEAEISIISDQCFFDNKKAYINEDLHMMFYAEPGYYNLIVNNVSYNNVPSNSILEENMAVFGFDTVNPGSLHFQIDSISSIDGMCISSSIDVFEDSLHLIDYPEFQIQQICSDSLGIIVNTFYNGGGRINSSFFILYKDSIGIYLNDTFVDFNSSLPLPGTLIASDSFAYPLDIDFTTEIRSNCGNIIFQSETNICDQLISGCMDSTAHNYNPLAQISDGQCETCHDGIMNGDEEDVDCGGLFCDPCIYGCTDPTSSNFDPSATVDDGSCASCDDGIQNGDEEDVDCGGSVCIPCYYGCTDELAHNYSDCANVDDGTCETCDDGIMNGDEIGLDCGGEICTPCTGLGCTDTLAHNYDPSATIDDGNCETCDDGIMNGDEEDVDCGGALCLPCIYGCIDSTAHNYNPLANANDGNCETCYDGIKNGDEEDIDCGGSLCVSCLFECTDTLTFWDFSNPSPFSGNTLPNFSTIPLSVGPQSGMGKSGNGSFAWIYGANSNSFDSLDYFEFGVTSDSIPFKVENIRFDFKSDDNGTGVTNWILRSSIDNFQSNLAVSDTIFRFYWSPHYVETSEFPVNLDSIKFRFYIWGGTGTWPRLYIDNIILGCAHASCYDGFLNQDEYGVDCGGICTSCDSCSITNISIQDELCTTSNDGKITLDVTNGCVPPYFVSMIINYQNGGADYRSFYAFENPILLDYISGPSNVDINIMNSDGMSVDTSVMVDLQTSYDYSTSNSIDSVFILESTGSLAFPAIVSLRENTSGIQIDVDTFSSLPMFFSNLVPGPYEAQITDANGCYNFVYFTIQPYGCTNPNAHNYDPAAIVDDGTCETCDDGIQNGDETEIDCGGVICDPCECNLEVMNLLDSGDGSFREVIDCANTTAFADTVSFNTAVYTDTIVLSSDSILIQESIYIIAPPGQSIVIDASDLAFFLYINAGISVWIEGVTIIAPELDPKSILRNYGNVTLKDVAFKKSLDSSESFKVENFGNLVLEGMTVIENK